MENTIKEEIVVNNQIINIIRIGEEEYISLTDLARYEDDEDLRFPVQNWMRNKEVISYLGLWGRIHNINFKGCEFAPFKNEAGSTNLKCLHKSGLRQLMQLG